MGEENQESIRYSFKGKIMITSIIILFLACFVIVSFHVYARWCRRRRRRRPFTAVTPQGLDLRAVNSLPTFVCGSENQESPPECAVCLSEFQDGETGRILPECKHGFHAVCIDSWLRSHRDCPLCRARVKVGIPCQPDCTAVSLYVLSGSGFKLSPTDGIRICCPSSSSSEALEPDIPKQSTSPNVMGRDPTAPALDPDGNSGQDPGFRVSRFWL